MFGRDPQVDLLIEKIRAGTLKNGDLLEAYDEVTAALGDAAARASVVRNAHPDEKVRDQAEQDEQALEKKMTELALDPKIYAALSSIPREPLDAVTRHWLEKTLRDFRRAGVDKDDATRGRVRTLNETLVRIGQEFGRNILSDVRKVSLSPSELEGLPLDYVRAHPPGADGRVNITTDGPDYLPFMTYAKSAKAREALWRAYRLRGHPANEAVLSSLVAHRHELARLLGYPSWAAYATEDKMIETPERAADFIGRITVASEGRCQKDYAQLLKRRRQDEPTATAVMPWDQAYCEDRIRAENFASDSQALRPYFEYRAVREGVLNLTARVFGLRYSRVEDVRTWHADVEVFDLFQSDKKLGRFFLDMHPRPGKYKHAAQFTLTTGKVGRRLPEGVLMCNFPKPGAEPALMQHKDVQTFFHEFGHLLHHIFGGHTRWAGVSGVRTEWDFVEAPSQLLEEWAWDVACLQTFAKHVETGEPIPAEAVARMRQADEFGKGLWVRQQMFYAALSLELYRQSPQGLDIGALSKKLQEGYTPFQAVEGAYFHLSFGHLDGYSAIYYTYMWSLVIAKDLFTVFEREGLQSAAAADRYRRAVLAPGGSKDAAELVKDFLGREFGFEAYERWLNAA